MSAKKVQKKDKTATQRKPSASAKSQEYLRTKRAILNKFGAVKLNERTDEALRRCQGYIFHVRGGSHDNFTESGLKTSNAFGENLDMVLPDMVVIQRALSLYARHLQDVSDTLSPDKPESYAAQREVQELIEINKELEKLTK